MYNVLAGWLPMVTGMGMGAAKDPAELWTAAQCNTYLGQANYKHSDYDTAAQWQDLCDLKLYIDLEGMVLTYVGEMSIFDKSASGGTAALVQGAVARRTLV